MQTADFLIDQVCVLQAAARISEFLAEALVPFVCDQTPANFQAAPSPTVAPAAAMEKAGLDVGFITCGAVLPPAAVLKQVTITLDASVECTMAVPVLPP